MIPPPDKHEKLEHLIHQTLRELPARRAPRSLEERVRAEIERRALLPWWRKSFAHWPVAARACFLLASVGVAKLGLWGAVWVMSGFDNAQFREAFAPQFTWMESGLAVVHAVTGFFDIMLRNIPPLWLYGGLAFVAATYFALFGLGAAAYRTLSLYKRR
jgi:hypothetical protein